MTRLLWLLPLLLLGAQPTTSHLLGWDTTASPVEGFTLEQCQQTRTGCAMQPLASFDAQTLEAEVTGLLRNKSYCWRLTPYAAGQMYDASNTVCVKG
jgi:hypothetical protein